MSTHDNVVRCQYALACHSALLNILFAACKSAVARGLMHHEEAAEALSLAAQANAGSVRGACEVVLARLHERPLGATR